MADQKKRPASAIISTTSCDGLSSVGVAISDLQNLFKRVLKVFGLRRITGLVD
jgi:hypothetical protein